MGKVSFEMLKSWVNLVKYAMSFSILELGEVSFEMVDFESLCTAFNLMKSEIVFFISRTVCTTIHGGAFTSTINQSRVLFYVQYVHS